MIALTLSSPVRVLGHSHRPDEDRAPRRADRTRELQHLFATRRRQGLERLPVRRGKLGGEFVEANRVLADEVGVDPVLLDHVLESAGEKADVAANPDLE